MAVNVGFIGLGNIGYPIAKNIVRAGDFTLTVFDLRPEPLREFATYGAQVAASPAEVGRACEIVGVCVFDDEQVEEVVAGSNGLLRGARPDTIIAIHSTVPPRTVVKLAALAAEHGVHVLDVPITGGAFGAEARTLCYMAGGDAALIDRCRPVFETSGKTVVCTGALGSGMAMKLCNNLITYLQFLALFEAMQLAKAGGVSIDALVAVTQANGVMTPPMSALMQRYATPGSNAANSAGSARFAELGEKDLGEALAYARELGVSLPATGLCAQLIATVAGATERRPKN